MDLCSVAEVAGDLTGSGLQLLVSWVLVLLRNLPGDLGPRCGGKLIAPNISSTPNPERMIDIPDKRAHILGTILNVRGLEVCNIRGKG